MPEFVIFHNDKDKPVGQADFNSITTARAVADDQYGSAGHSLFQKYEGATSFLPNPHTMGLPKEDEKRYDVMFEGVNKVYRGLTEQESDSVGAQLNRRSFRTISASGGEYGSANGTRKVADVIKLDGEQNLISYGQFTEDALRQEVEMLNKGEQIYCKDFQ